MKKKLVMMMVCSAVLFSGGIFSPEGHAADYRTRWIAKKEPIPHTKWGKAGRGSSNLLLGWTEMAYQPFLMAEEGHRWPVALGGGLIKGFCYGLNRMAVGLYELITFPFPIPKDYRPIIEPELPFPQDRKIELY